MTRERWTAVDQYFEELLVPQDTVLEEALADSAAAGLPPISVSPSQGKLLQLLARVQGAQSILEIGTLGGYSTIWLARALPADGRLITLESMKKHADVARANFERAALGHMIELLIGPAQETLPRLVTEGRGPFDMIFVDADKVGYPEYFGWALRLSRPGTLMVFDNVVRNGAVIEADSVDEKVQGVRRFNELLAAEPRVSATAIQTVGSKGYDGLTIVVVNDE